MTKYYIGCVSDYKGGTVRMLNTKNELVPHIKGGANSGPDGLTFISYEESQVNKTAMKKMGLRFLTRDEVAHFMRGENLKGEKLEAPKAPVISDDEKKDMIETIKSAIAERKENGESYGFLVDMLNRLEGVAE